MEFSARLQNAPGKRKRHGNDDHDNEEAADIEPAINVDTDNDGDDESHNSDAKSDGEDDDEDDNDEGDDDEGSTGRCQYNEHDEQLPKCVAYDKAFAQVAMDLVSIPAHAVTIIDRSDYNSNRVQNCRGIADALSIIPDAKREKVALLGNTGTGKSSLLNSLLGLPNLAKAVEYFDIGAIQELLSRLLEDYSTWTFEKQDDWDEDEVQELKHLSTTAFTTLSSLFCDKEEFESSPAAIGFLQQCYNDPNDVAHETLVGWCEELLEEKEADEDDHLEYLDADTQSELLEQLNPLVFSTCRYEKPALWPLVKKVRVGLAGPLILKHVTVVDLPGLNDTNQVRVDASLDIMRSCDSIWIVTKIDRVITDSTVDSLLMRYGRAFKIVIICTGIDDNLDPALAAQLELEGQSIGDHNNLLQREHHLRMLIKRLPKKIESRKAKLNGRAESRAKKKKSLTERARAKLELQVNGLAKELAAAEAELSGVASERFEVLVNARNANAIRRLKEEKSDHLPTGKMLDVFAVSNLHYSALKGARIISGPCLNAKDTGIPALRTFVLQSAAPFQLQAVEDYMNHRYTVFMQGIAMWARSFSVEGSDVLLEAIKRPSDRVQELLDSYRDKVLAANEKINVKTLEEARSPIVAAALDESRKKSSWAWSTIRAFLRRLGNHKTSVAPKQSWNQQFLKEASKVFRTTWESFLREQQTLTSALEDEMLGLVHSIRNLVEAHPASLVLPMDRIKEVLSAQVEGIEQAFCDFREEHEKELRNINLDLTQDRNSGYFSQAMSEAYAKCKGDARSGVKGRSVSTFETHLTLEGERSPFHVMLQKLCAALAKGNKLKSKILGRKVKDILTEIYRQFSDMIDEKIDDHCEEEVRRQFKAFLPGAEAKFEDIRADLARIKRRYEV